jgi:DNA-binding NarL/FixJ family response regulator
VESISLVNSTAITSGFTQKENSATHTQTAAADKIAATTQTASEQQDSVKLSAKAQAKLLHQEGQSVSAIAASLGISVKTVDSYLGITLTSTIEDTLQETESASTTA